MRRDMDLVRDILLQIEAYPSSLAPEELIIEGYSDEQVSYHVLIMGEAGLLEVATTGSKTSSPGAIPIPPTCAARASEI